MKNKRITELQRGFETAFIDQSVPSNLAYKPQFISNNYKNGRKVLSSIEDELLVCEEFYISVAFITMSGITPLLQTFEKLEKRNIRGRILTTDYLNFSEPKALSKLRELKNIELKMYMTDGAEEGFHTKGYIFKKEEIFRIIIGSSNMTMSALTKNKEWNARIVSAEQGEYTNEILEEFFQLWDSECAKKYDDFIETYTLNYNIIKKQQKIAKESNIPSIEVYKLKPNFMQREFVSSLQKIREAGEKKALLISATGTGKTYASAFALREENHQKVLFIVHREQIAKQAMKSYKNVFGKTKTFGLLSGSSKEFKADYLFSTMQMISKAEVRRQFRPDEFQMIVIDEAHHAGASSYRSIMEYFKPEFWLGMTASPERTDNFDVYRAFDNNIAYEIRLQQALEENLLCPFHYFGITDLMGNGESAGEEMGLKDFNRLTSDERRLIAISKQSRSKESEDVQNFINAEKLGIKVDLFVRKNKDDKISKEFYYLGRMKVFEEPEEVLMKNTDKKAVKIKWMLDTPVRKDIYEYIISV
jgi:HKD family nuclease